MLDKIKDQVVEHINSTLDRAYLKKEIETADYYILDEPTRETAVVEILSSDQNGQYMVPSMLKSFGIDVENEIVEEEGFWDWVHYELLPARDKAIGMNDDPDVGDVYVEFFEGGLGILVSRDVEEKKGEENE